jgi:tetratricopeptide (TPR) repeat protein
MIRSIFFILAILFGGTATDFAQVSTPRESQRQEIIQTVGDTRVSIVYHRPNAKARKIWGCETTDVIPIANNLYPCLVPYGQVWRAGANENTTIEFSRDVTVNGSPLPAGKYGLHVIPQKSGPWTVIFSRDNDKWGSFSYDEKKDALRVSANPMKAPMQETLTYEFDDVTASTTLVKLRWDKIELPLTVAIGDIHGRVLASVREAIKNRKSDDFRPYNQGAAYVRTFKLRSNYDEALGWIDASIKGRETVSSLNIKAGILAEMGRFDEAVALGEKALQLGKTSTPPASKAQIVALEDSIKKWKAKRT